MSVFVLTVICQTLFFSLAFSYSDVKQLKLGVEITGIKLQDHLNDSLLFDRIKEDIKNYRLMVFRKQGEIPAHSMIKMFERFGEIYHEPYTTQTKSLHNHPKAPAPAIMRISNDVAEGFKGVGTSGWHIDGAYKPIPFSHLIFNAIKAPIIGDTKFVGHKEALTSMSKKSLKFMDQIWAVNTRTLLGEKTATIHPLIYNHPVVNESVFCLHLGYMKSAIYDDGRTEYMLKSNELARLKDEVTQTFDTNDNVYSHKWEDGDLVIIDNLQLAHLASKESQLPKEKIGLRVLHRLAIIGSERPTKRHSLFPNHL